MNDPWRKYTHEVALNALVGADIGLGLEISLYADKSHVAAALAGLAEGGWVNSVDDYFHLPRCTPSRSDASRRHPTWLQMSKWRGTT